MDVDRNECLLLEDLNNRGFTMIDHVCEEITVDHVHLYLQALAKFHAIGLAINDQQPEKFKQFTVDLNDVYMCKGYSVSANFEAFYAVQAENALNTVSAAEDAHLHAKLKAFFAKSPMNVAIESIERELNESATVISYGDAHQHNTM